MIEEPITKDLAQPNSGIVLLPVKVGADRAVVRASGGLANVLTRVPRALAAAPRRMNGVVLSFVLAVLLPTIVAGSYLMFVASDQYVAETRFGVRFAELTQNDVSSIFQGMPAASQIGLASTAITQFLQSREIVDTLQARIDLRRIYSNPAIDPLSRLSPAATAEETVDYWRGKVDPFFDLTTGAISVRVKAFTPGDAQLISANILSLSEALVNDMSTKSREQAIQLNKEQVASAEVRLEKAREDMRMFRNGQSVIDAGKEAESRLTLVTKLRGDLAQAQGEMTRLHAYLNDDAPTVKDLQHQIAAVQGQLALAEAQLTSKDTTVAEGSLSSSMGGYEALQAKTAFAQKYYDSMMEALLTAQVEANRQLSYLAVFVHPALPQSALYPRRVEDTVLAFLTCGGVWLMLLLGYRALREHVV